MTLTQVGGASGGQGQVKASLAAAGTKGHFIVLFSVQYITAALMLKLSFSPFFLCKLSF